MSEKKKVVSYPGRPRRKLKRKALAAAIGLCVVVAAILFLGQVIASWEARKDLRALENKLQEARKENERLQEEMVLLQDMEYIEIKARERLGLVRPGETIFYVVD